MEGFLGSNIIIIYRYNTIGNIPILHMRLLSVKVRFCLRLFFSKKMKGTTGTILDRRTEAPNVFDNHKIVTRHEPSQIQNSDL